MVKKKSHYVCQSCGSISPKWHGQCVDCHAWNTLLETEITTQKIEDNSYQGYATSEEKVHFLGDITAAEVERVSTGLVELDRVLGGGLVPGSVTLLGGDPGIGKSTLLLQTCQQLVLSKTVLYVTGEESLQQVKLRAMRLKSSHQCEKLRLYAATQVEAILKVVMEEKPEVMVIDSIQTLFTARLTAAPGSVSQIRESAAQLVRFAKQTQTSLFFVGHVTKEGALAGPRVLEHMVDTVLYFEGDQDNRFRLLRAVKNRFGAVNELGIFAMTEYGLCPVSNPSAIFLSSCEVEASGRLIMVAWEGSRPLLVEVQALVSDTQAAMARRLSVGFDTQRLSMLLAIMQRYGNVSTLNQDVFINIVGGIKVNETAADLSVLAAIAASSRNTVPPNDLVIFGEIGLSGEIRPVQRGLERLKEAQKHGFKNAVVPCANVPKKPLKGLSVQGVSTVSQALEYFS